MNLLKRIIHSFKDNWYLIIQLSKREVQRKNKGSYLGMVWSVINPILMIVIYTFVFSVIFEARWGMQNDNQFAFAVVLYCGLNTFLIFQEAMIVSPTLIAANQNYVKKVVFPIEILGIVTVNASLFNSLIGYAVLLIANLILTGQIFITVLLLPVVIIPIIMLSYGISWLLCSLGVYFKDLGSFINVLATVLLFMSPIFYSLEAVPEQLKIIYIINPLTHIIENCRAVLVYGTLPNWLTLGGTYLVGFVIMLIGYKWFMGTKSGFADAI